jgi:hypothetical protein
MDQCTLPVSVILIIVWPFYRPYDAMMTYSVDCLLALYHTRPPAKTVRKTIFSLRLWVPASARKSAVSVIGSINSGKYSSGKYAGHRPVSFQLSVSTLEFGSKIPVMIGRRGLAANEYKLRDQPLPRTSVLTAVRVQSSPCRATSVPLPHVVPATPTLYVLNAAALSKPGAVHQLEIDLKSTGASVAVITETHFKQRHADNVISIYGYTVF